MSSNDAPTLVKGKILLSKEICSFSGARVNVYLENVSFLDMQAKIAAKQVIFNVDHYMGTENWVEFALKGEITDVSAKYSIRVHIALHEDEQIHLGDYISIESYPVLTFGYPNQVSVGVKQVK